MPAVRRKRPLPARGGVASRIRNYVGRSDYGVVSIPCSQRSGLSGPIGIQLKAHKMAAPAQKENPDKGEMPGLRAGSRGWGDLIRPPYSPKQQAVDESSSS